MSVVRYLVLYILIAGIVTFVSWLGVTWYFRTSLSSRTNTGSIVQGPVDTIASQSSSIRSEIEKTEMKSGRTYYAISAEIVEIKKLQNGTIAGSLYFSKDPERRVWSYTVNTLGGTIPVGFFAKSFDGAHEARFLSVSRVLSFIQSGSSVQIRATYPTSPAPGSLQASMQNTFEAILMNKWGSLTVTPLIIDGFGVIGSYKELTK